MKRWIAASFVLGFAAAIAAQHVPLAPEQTLDRRVINDPQFSPDGSRLVFTVTDPPKGTARERNLWMLDVATGQTRQLTAPSKGGFGARWAPDGRSLAFLSERDGGSPHLYRLWMTGGDAVRIVDHEEGVGAFRWSPDGGRIALLMNEPKPEALRTRERDKDDGRVVDKDDRLSRLWTVDVNSREIRQVTRDRFQINQVEWLPDGQRLVAHANAHPESDRWDERIYSIALSDGSFTEIAAPRGPFGQLAVSPDGRTLAYVGARLDGPEPHDVWLQPTGGGVPRNLTAATIDRPVSQPRWLDQSTLTGLVARGFGSTLYAFPVEGQPRIVEGVGPNPSAVAQAPNGATAFVGETTTSLQELWLKDPSGAARQVTNVNGRWASVPLVSREFIKYKSVDGVEIEAALLKPEGAGPFPFVVLVHGGPTGRWTDTFEPWGQLLVSRGYAVLYPNVRGSTGYGERFVEMNRADWGGGDFKDVMAGVDAMIARGIADPNRLGIGGWSYGGYMAAWAVTQTTRFKAAVSGAPVIDMASEYGTEHGPAYDEWFYGTPYEKPDGFIRSSPVTYVKNARTPTLLLQGEDDVTDPIGQSQQFYRGLKRYGVETDLVVYPREGHGPREERHVIDVLARVVGGVGEGA